MSTIKEFSELFERAGLSQSEVARRYHVGQTTVWDTLNRRKDAELSNKMQGVYDAMLKDFGASEEVEEAVVEQELVKIDNKKLIEAVKKSQYGIKTFKVFLKIDMQNIGEEITKEQLESICTILEMPTDEFIVVEEPEVVAPTVNSAELGNIVSALRSLSDMLPSKKQMADALDEIACIENLYNKVNVIVPRTLKTVEWLEELNKKLDKIEDRLNAIDKNIDMKFSAIIKAFEEESMSEEDRALLLLSDLLKKGNRILEVTAYKQANELGISKDSLNKARGTLNLVSSLDNGKTVWKKR